MKGTEKGYKTLSKHPETVHTGIEVLWRQQKLCDVFLVSRNGKRIPAHRLVLATCCDYFFDLFAEENMHQGLNNRVELLHMGGNALETLVEAMYTGKLKIEAGNVDEILSSAATLGMFSAMEACEDFLLDLVTKDNCLHILTTAFKYDFTRLTEHTLHTAAVNFQVISKRAAFKTLATEHLVSLLKRNDLKAENELEVFHRARTWIETDRHSRLQYAAEVMTTIRLPLLSPAEVIDNVECCAFLMGIAECQRLVKDSLHYHLMPARQCLLQVHYFSYLILCSRGFYVIACNYLWYISPVPTHCYCPSRQSLSVVFNTCFQAVLVSFDRLVWSVLVSSGVRPFLLLLDFYKLYGQYVLNTIWVL